MSQEAPEVAETTEDEVVEESVPVVFVPSLAGKTANLPHTEQGLRPISFHEGTGQAYVKDVERDEDGVDVLVKGRTVPVERELTEAEVQSVQEHLHLFGVVVT